MAKKILIADDEPNIVTALEFLLEAFLGELAMGKPRFEVRFGAPLAEPGWGPSGFDAAEFYLSPNPGEDTRPLARIVSGGVGATSSTRCGP